MANPDAKPEFLEDCDSWQRNFPESWKSAYWRLNGGANESGYQCPICKRYFKGGLGYQQLHGDHKLPYSLFRSTDGVHGPTTWDNFWLICGTCNLEKHNVPSVVQTKFGRLAFLDYSEGTKNSSN